MFIETLNGLRELDILRNRIIAINEQRGITIEKERESLFSNLVEEMHEVYEAKNDGPTFVEHYIEELCDVLMFTLPTIPESEKLAFRTFVLKPLEAIEKEGFDAQLCLLEVIKKVESRKGHYNGAKWVKDKSDEARKQWYRPQIETCRKEQE